MDDGLRPRARARDRPGDVWQTPGSTSSLRRVAVVALDVPAIVAAQNAAAISDVVMAVQGSEVSALRAVRRSLASGHIDGVLAYSSDWSRQNYPSLYEIVLSAVTGGRAWFLADGATRSVSRRGGIRMLAPVAQFATGAMYTIGQALAAQREAVTAIAPASPNRALSGATGKEPASRWVLVVWRGSPTTVGGSITHLQGVLHGFRELGYRVALVSGYPLPPGVDQQVDCFAIPGPLEASRRFTPDTARLALDRQLARLCRDFAHDISPVCVYQRSSYQCAAGSRVAAEIGAPFVLEWNSSEVWAKRRMWGSNPLQFISAWFERGAESRESQVVSSATVVAAVSQLAADMAVERGGVRERILIVPNAVVLRDIPPPEPLPVRAPGALLGWVGTYGPWHGADVAVRAMVQLPSRVRLLMIGDGDARMRCEDLAVELGVQTRIEFTGSLPRAEAIARLQHCDVLLSPQVPFSDTPFFGSPTKIFEYMAIGRPIVASRLEQIAEILEDGSTARLVAPGDEVALAAGILDVLDRGDRGASLGHAARQEAATRHTWEARVKQIVQALQQSGESSAQAL